MVAKPKPTEEFDPTADVQASPDDWQWDTVEEGAAAKVIFEEVGDTFVGMKLGKKYIENEPSADGEDRSFEVWEFRGRDGDLYQIPDSFALNQGLVEIPDGVWCRITLVKLVPTARKLNPLKSFKIDVRRQ